MMDRKQTEVQVRLHRTVIAYCRRHIFDPQGREECALEFVEYVLLFLDEEKRDVLLADGNERLLRRVAVCFVLNWAQKLKRLEAFSICLTDLPECVRSMLTGSNAEVFARSIRAFANNSLHDAIMQLPTKQRQCAIRCWLEGQSVTDIAAELDLAPAAVRKNLQYARDNVRKTLEEIDIDEKDWL